jgi:hypothetical protein
LLTVYAAAEAVAVVDLDPLLALGLGAQLIDAGRLHLLRQQVPARRRRGGDPKAALRRERDTAALALAQLLAPGQPFEEQARIVIGRVLRYQPAAGEIGAERQLMGQIRATGLPLPSADRMARILSARSGTGVNVGAEPGARLSERLCSEHGSI